MTTQIETEEMPEPNTSEMVDYIIITAKEAAETEKSIDLMNEALEYIQSNIDNAFADNETMETMMYYGALLNYMYVDTWAAEIGSDTVQMIKYVYRGIETPEDEATEENKKQVLENLNTYWND